MGALRQPKDRGVRISGTFIVCQPVDLNMMENAFDDQYLGCADKMEGQMAEILKQEMNQNPQLKEMWKKAEQTWQQKKDCIVNLPGFPRGFKDAYGIAINLYTKKIPFPIYQQLNRNTSEAGESLQYYKNKFKFKALHFYLTRALQMLSSVNDLSCRSGCRVYRGTDLTFRIQSSDVRFGHFASSSLNLEIAQAFGKTIFNIRTLFGVKIKVFSDSPEEEEVLIPVTEKFHLRKKSETSYVMESRGQQCSYYNCALQGGKKELKPKCIPAHAKPY